MRQSKASYAIIKHNFDGINKHLLQYNAGWNAYNFISGHIEDEDGGDYEKTIIRELEEELPPISYGKDFIVEPICRTPFKGRAYSLKAREETEYTFYLFFVKFLVPFDQLTFLWEKGSLNRWFSGAELREGKSLDKRYSITAFPVPQIMESGLMKRSNKRLRSYPSPYRQTYRSNSQK